MKDFFATKRESSEEKADQIRQSLQTLNLPAALDAREVTSNNTTSTTTPQHPISTCMSDCHCHCHCHCHGHIHCCCRFVLCVCCVVCVVCVVLCVLCCVVCVMLCVLCCVALCVLGLMCFCGSVWCASV